MRAYLPHLKLQSAACLFGISALVGHLLTVPADTIVMGRGAFALVTLSLISVLMGRRPWGSVSRGTALSLVLIGMALAAHWVVFFLAVRYGGVAMATLGFATFPAFTALAESALQRTWPSRHDWLTLILVSAGLLLVTPSVDAGADALAGLGLGVLSGASYAGIALANRYLRTPVDGFTSCWWQYLGIVICLLPFTWDVRGIGVQDWLLLCLLGTGCTALAYTLYVAALRDVKATIAAVVLALEPVYAIAGAWLLFGSVPALTMMLGGALIVAAVIAASVRSARPRPEPVNATPSTSAADSQG